MLKQLVLVGKRPILKDNSRAVAFGIHRLKALAVVPARW
jgi:hypothetical protein